MNVRLARALCGWISVCGASLGCAAPAPATCRTAADCGSEQVCLDGTCAPRRDGGGGFSDARPADAGPPPRDVALVDSGRCVPGCAPGEACVNSACVADCRLPEASTCAQPRVCGPTSGRCVMQGEECTAMGEFVSCGTQEFPPSCGPGSRCVAERCEPAAGCARVICDASGNCRGVECASMNATASGVTLAPVSDPPRGAAGSIAARATVTGTNLCGVTATIEVRVETSLYTSAANDNAIFEIDLATGARTPYASGISQAFGFATDPNGAVYVVRGTDCAIGRLDGAPGARTFVMLAQGPSGCSRLAAGTDAALYVSGGLQVRRVDLFTRAVTTFGTIPDGSATWGTTFLTGLTFDASGRLFAGEHWRGVFAFGETGGVGTRFADAPARGLLQSDNPWNEGMAFDQSGRLHVGVFPNNASAGFLWSADATGTTRVEADLASIRAMVPATNYTGIHGVAFGLDDTLYFTNQNTPSDTRQPLGQLLARAPGGTMRVLASGLNFDWPLGYDGDVIVGTRVVASVTVPVDAAGNASADLDAPAGLQPFQVRVLVTDPATGRVRVASRVARTR